jgi:hypothetical protein
MDFNDFQDFLGNLNVNIIPPKLCAGLACRKDVANVRPVFWMTWCCHVLPWYSDPRKIVVRLTFCTGREHHALALLRRTSSMIQKPAYGCIIVSGRGILILYERFDA